MSWLQEFALAGSAASTACFFTNPVELVKTRLQLQGELQKIKQATVVYKGPIHAFRLILQHEGFRGIQKGLSPAILYQISMNGTRLGSYSTIQKLLGADHTTENRTLVFLRNMVSAAGAGALAALLGSPFFLIKVRMQSASSWAAVGTQYDYKNVVDAFSKVWREGGVRGLYRGAEGAMLRVAIGSSVQLSTYDHFKHLITASPLAERMQSPVAIHLCSSLLAGFASTVAMNPVDVVSTRLYNQKVSSGHGSLYSGPFDCLVKTFRAEGLRGLYKGFWAHYLRLGPHTVLTFIFWEQYKALANSYTARQKKEIQE